MDAASMIAGRKHAFQNLGYVLVLGLGVTGRAVVEYVAPMVGERVASLVVLGGKSNDANDAWAAELLDKYRSSDIKIVFDDEDASKYVPVAATSGKFDLCIASPGISAFSDFYQNGKAASCELIGEVELAWCESSADSVWIAITGTNGKTTTTSLIEHILRSSGLDAKAVGNIGDAGITEVARDIDETDASGDAKKYYVVETSSYQLASVNKFKPNVAVILGITPDHIKWHRTHEHYAASKFNLLKNLGSGDVAILDATNDEVRAKIRKIKGDVNRQYHYIPLGTAQGIGNDMRTACGATSAAFAQTCGDDEATDNGQVRLVVAFDGGEHALCKVSDLQILGTHNVVNALAGASAAVAAGVPDKDVAAALTTFAPLEHRIEPCGTHNGIRFYNDSKATNVDATLQALQAFDGADVLVMLGGDDKGTDLSELVDVCAKNIAVMVCYGEGGPRFYDALKHLDGTSISSNNSQDPAVQKVFLEKTFDEAFDRACSEAQPTDVVLLSPACASFDEFSCFEERGEHFKHLVNKL